MLYIRGILWSETSEQHVWDRHKLTTEEVEEAASNAKLIRKGRGQMVYEVWGQTDSGRYLFVVVRFVEQNYVRIITARLMSDVEKCRFKRMTEH